MVRRVWILGAFTALVLAATGGTALARSARGICVGSASQTVTASNKHGKCSRGSVLVSLATKSQVKALQTQVKALQSQEGTLQSDVSTLQSQVSGLQADVATATKADATLSGEVSSLQSDNTTLKSDDATLKNEVSALQTTLSKVSYKPAGLNGLPTLQISGANLQVVSGSGMTAGTVNGLGNVFIGYDEYSDASAQTGSNNLVLGVGQSFSSYGGLVGGQFGNVSGPYSAVLGSGNTASGAESSVTGGAGNEASGNAASISGGYINTATNNTDSVSGGDSNVASGSQSSVSGGLANTAGGQFSSILGGESQTLTASYSHFP